MHPQAICQLKSFIPPLTLKTYSLILITEPSHLLRNANVLTVTIQFNMTQILTPLLPSEAHQLCYNTPSEVLLIDVRTPAEFRSGAAAQATNLPLDQLDTACLDRLQQEGKQILLLCKAGGRAAKACDRMRQAGIHARVVEGGTDAWRASDLPFHVESSGGLSLERQVRIAAGLLVMIGLALGTWSHPGGYGLSAFVGAGLIFAGITDWCGMGLLLARMPWNH